MKTFLILTFSFLASSFVTAQNRDTPDQVATDNGNVTIQPITHGTVVLEWNNLFIYVDPYGGAARFEGLNDPDIVLITDIHGDHLHMNTLNELNLSGAALFVPQAVMDKLPEEMKSKAKVIGNGENIDHRGLNIAAIPMYNLPDDETSRHKKGRGNGYIVTVGGKKIYFSGDTEDIPEMRALKDIHVAFVCMNLPYTMDIEQAASAVNEFKPDIVYPYHYRGSGGLSDIETFKLLVNAESPNVEVRIKNWYPKK